MSRFLESIAIQDGNLQRLSWHQERMTRTLAYHYPDVTIDLYAAIANEASRQTGLVKCRVLYDREITDLQFAAYSPRSIKTLKIVENNTLDYAFKYADRASIDELFNRRGVCDDILIVKNGWVTDSSIANVVFRKGDTWVTPGKPLLKGTMREYLMDSGLITETNIAVHDLPSFDGFKLINALLGFSSVEYPVSNINF